MLRSIIRTKATAPSVLRALCDTGPLEGVSFRIFVDKALRLHHEAQDVLAPADTPEWWAASRRFWGVPQVDGPSLTRSYKDYARRYHPDKLPALEDCPSLAESSRNDIAVLFKDMIQPAYRLACQFLNGEPEPVADEITGACATLEECSLTGEHFIRVMCDAVASDIPADDEDDARSLVQLVLPGEPDAVNLYAFPGSSCRLVVDLSGDDYPSLLDFVLLDGAGVVALFLTRHDLRGGGVSSEVEVAVGYGHLLDMMPAEPEDKYGDEWWQDIKLRAAKLFDSNVLEGSAKQSRKRHHRNRRGGRNCRRRPE